VPTGIRLIVDSGKSVVSELQYIQQPSSLTIPFVIGASPPTIRKITTSPSDATQITLEPAFTGAVLAAPNAAATVGDFTGGYGVNSDQSFWAVQPGDYLVVKGATHRVLSIDSTAIPKSEGNLITLASAVTFPLSGAHYTNDYYFLRKPRALVGESNLRLPQDVVIDLGSSKSIMPATNNQYDILFSPSGEVLFPQGANKVVLWVTDPSRPEQDTLIAVDLRTGFIAAHPVDTTSGDSYSFTKDGRSSGL
jgi:hypothetical protein